MRRVALIAWLVVTVFLIVRAIVELFAIDYSDPSSYQHDWAAPVSPECCWSTAFRA